MDALGKPLYSFGHGLSYTDFSYSDLSIVPSPDCKRWKVSCRVTNTGKRAGAEVVQLYMHDVVASLAQPPILLKGFDRIELKPGESREVTFNLGFDQLAIYNRDLRRVVEPGMFEVMVGSSSSDIRLKGEFSIKERSLDLETMGKQDCR